MRPSTSRNPANGSTLTSSQVVTSAQHSGSPAAVVASEEGPLVPLMYTCHNRKNWIHLGSGRAARRCPPWCQCGGLLAAEGVVREYLPWVLPGLGDVSVQRVRQYAGRLGCFPQLRMNKDRLWSGNLWNRSCSARRHMTPEAHPLAAVPERRRLSVL